MSSIGRAIPRKEGRSKVTGEARYVDDLTLPGMLHGATVRSPVARGILHDIHFDPSIPWNELVVVTADDIPGRNVVALIDDDQPYLASERVNHPEEPIVLLAHREPALLAEAARAITFDIEPLPPVFTIDEALDGAETIREPGNLFTSYRVARGDVEAAWASADLIVDGEYETGAQEQLYIETHGMLAVASPEQGVTVWGSLQCPYYVHKALAGLFALPAEKIRVVQVETGGGFGGKEEYPSIVAGHAALLAWKAGRPVKLVYTRTEDMVATTKRHPSRTRHRTGVKKDGTLVAMDIDFVIDGGAYCTLSPVVLSRGTIHAAGPYFCPNVRVRGRAVATNAPPHGAFRGFGAPQSLFALERHMDRVTAAVGLEPDEFRRRNFIRPGQTSAVGQVMRDPVDLGGLLDTALTHTDFRAKRASFAARNAGSTTRRGIGLAAFMHGAGFTGAGEDHLASVVTVELTRDGRARVLTSNTEIGQGTNTVLSQIAADALGIEPEDVEVAQPDTAAVPNSGPTVASRTCMVVGKLVEAAAATAARLLAGEALLAETYSREAFRQACAAYVERHGPLRASVQYQPPPGVRWDDETYQGDAYGSYAWAVYVAEVTVDLVTCDVRVDDFVAVQDVGKVLHPVLAAGQIEGGVVQGIGWALSERVVWRDGRMQNARMTDYIIPTATDVPPIHVVFAETPYSHGPAGAKGIGELPMDGPAPAILNAVAHATGVDPTRVPLTPEALMALIEAVHG